MRLQRVQNHVFFASDPEHRHPNLRITGCIFYNILAFRRNWLCFHAHCGFLACHLRPDPLFSSTLWLCSVRIKLLRFFWWLDIADSESWENSKQAPKRAESRNRGALWGQRTSARRFSVASVSSVVKFERHYQRRESSLHSGSRA